MWINSLGSRTLRISIYDIRRIARKLATFVRAPVAPVTISSMELVQPLVVPYYDIEWVRRLNAKLLTLMLHSKLEKAAFTNPILLSGTPLIADTVGAFHESSSHYLCTDDYAKFEGVFKAFDVMERVMIQKVDCMFATSDELLQTRNPRQREGIFLPQGVDTDHFVRQPEKIPDIMKGIPKPIIGFFGMIASWVDIQLIVKCAAKYPKASFVLIGKLGIERSTFAASPNIRYLGEVSYEELPLYAQAFDVGLIPFLKNDLTIAANPLKMLEYLSLGIPVVSTALPEARKFADVVHASDDSENFVQYVGQALGENSVKEQMQRRHRAEEFSWLRIVDEMSNTIEMVEREKA